MHQGSRFNNRKTLHTASSSEAAMLAEDGDEASLGSTAANSFGNIYEREANFRSPVRFAGVLGINIAVTGDVELGRFDARGRTGL